MKRILTIVFCALLTFAGAEISEAAPKEKAKTVTVVFETNIHCKNCAKKVEDNISFEKGVKALEVSVEKKTVAVTYDSSKTNAENLKTAIEKLGYTANIIKSN